MGGRIVTLKLDSHANTGAVARRAVQRLIGDDAPIRFVRDAILLTSELVSNATQYAGGCSFTACYEGSERLLRVDVADTCATVPTPADEGSEHGGWGLRMVRQIATRWGTTLSDTGKTVWFELEPTSR